MRQINEVFRGGREYWNRAYSKRMALARDGVWGLQDDDEDTGWMDILQQGIQTAGNVLVANRGGMVRSVPGVAGTRPSVTMTGAQSIGLGGISNTTLLLVGSGVLAYMLLKK